MLSESDKICVDSLENLKSLANATNKELETLHTKHLFSKFCTSHFEFLLEDIEKGKYDESRLHLMKRVNWHMLNSFDTKEAEVSAECPTHADASGVTHSIKESMSSRKGKRGKQKNKLTSIFSKLKYVDAFLDDKISESAKRKKDLQISKHTKFCSCILCNLANNEKTMLTQHGKEQISMKSNTEKNMSRSKKITGVKNVGSFSHLPESRLQKCIIPNINIPPMNKSDQLTINILPRKIDKKHPKKGRIPKRTQSTLEYKSNLEIFKNDSINILPLTKQRQPSIVIPSHRKKKHVSSINQGLFIFELPPLHTQVDEESESEVESNSRDSYPCKSEEEHTSQKISLTDDTSSAVISEGKGDVKVDKKDAQTDISLQGNVFNPERFLGRFEERLGNVLMHFPKQHFQEKTDAVPNVTYDHGVIGASSHESTSYRISSRVHVSVQTESPKISENAESKSLQSDVLHLTSAEKPSSASGIFEDDLNLEEASHSQEDAYSEESFEQSEDDSSPPCENETKEKMDVEDGKAVQNGKGIMERVDEAGLTLLERTVDIDNSEVERAEETKEIAQNEHISSSVHSPSRQVEVCSSDENIPTHLSRTASETVSQEPLNDEETSHVAENKFSSPSPNGTDSQACAGENDERGRMNKESSPVCKSEKNESLSVIPTEEPDTIPSVKDPTLSSTSFASDVEEEPSCTPLEEIKPVRLGTDSVSKSLSSETSTDFALVNESASISAGEAIAPSIEIADVTVSDGEIEFDATISDIQPGSHIAIKFSTRDIGLVCESLRKIPQPATQTNVGFHPQLVSKETQTPKANVSEIVVDSSFSEGVVLDSNEAEAAVHKILDEVNEDVTARNYYSEGEILDVDSLRSSSIKPDEIKFLGKENEILRRRLAFFTGRFCLPSSHQNSS